MLKDTPPKRLPPVGFLLFPYVVSTAYHRLFEGMEKLMDKIKQSDIMIEGDLAFVNDWELFWSGRSRSFFPSCST
jgi:hypothetical protein